jgi:hypothetical protein
MAEKDERYKAFMTELRDLLRRYDAELQNDTVGWGHRQREAMVVWFNDGMCHELPTLIDGKEPTH